MKSRRHATPTALVFCIALIATLSASRPATAQQKPEEKPSPPAEKKDLIIVQPATTQVPAPNSQQPAGQQKPGEVDDKGPVITNTDLITFTVTVTDIYGRFVQGLTKDAFSIFDEKQQQNILFFSDDDAPVSVGVIFDVSGSMSGDKVKRARRAVSLCANQSRSRRIFSNCF